MATLRVTVQLPATPTRAEKSTIYCYSGSTPQGSSTGNIGGNIRARHNSPNSQYAYDLNGPRIPGSISVTGFSPAQFDSADLMGQPSLVDQLSRHIEAGVIEVVDEAAPLVPLTRTDLTGML